MRRFLLSLVLVFAFANPAMAAASTQVAIGTQLQHLVTSETTTDGQDHLPEVKDVVPDRRAVAIDALLAHYHSPITGMGQNFVDAADRDGYDWRLLVAIAGVESGFGKHQISYNLFGWGGGRTRFRSFGDAINQVSAALSRRYIQRGLVTPARIQPVYCPPNPAWAGRVSHFMAQIGKP